MGLYLSLGSSKQAIITDQAAQGWHNFRLDLRNRHRFYYRQGPAHKRSKLSHLRGVGPVRPHLGPDFLVLSGGTDQQNGVDQP